MKYPGTGTGRISGAGSALARLAQRVTCTYSYCTNVFGFGDDKVDRSFWSVGIVFGSERVETYDHNAQHVCGLHSSMTTEGLVIWVCNYSNIVYNFRAVMSGSGIRLLYIVQLCGELYY